MFPSPRFIFLAVAWVCLDAAHAGGIIEGQIVLPKRRAAPVMNKRYEIITKGGVIATNPPVAVVYLEGNFRRSGTMTTVQMAQKDFAFVPALLAIERGTRVEFPNFDDGYHNVFSYSPAKRFDLGRYRPDERPIPSQVFDVAGPVTLRCDIHEHMRGLILVVDTPFFVITDTEGRFRLNAVPAGSFKLKAWIDSRTTLEKTVDPSGSGTLRVDFP